MGGAANDIQRGLTAASTFGLSEVAKIKTGNQSVDKALGTTSNIAKNASVASGINYVAAAGVRTGAGLNTIANAPRDAAKIAADAAAEQNRRAAAAEAKLAIQPKKTASDDFLANKNKMLTNMRLGLQSSVGSAGGAPAPSLSAPALSGKSKLGS